MTLKPLPGNKHQILDYLTLLKHPLNSSLPISKNSFVNSIFLEDKTRSQKSLVLFLQFLLCLNRLVVQKLPREVNQNVSSTNGKFA